MGSKIIQVNGVQDLSKLKGWTIQEMTAAPGAEPGFRLLLTHPAAEGHVHLLLTASATVVLNGNMVAINPRINMKLEDVP